jgi:hypothetical protein
LAHGAAYTEEARGSIGGTWREVRSACAPPTSPPSPCMTMHPVSSISTDPSTDAGADDASPFSSHVEHAAAWPQGGSAAASRLPFFSLGGPLSVSGGVDMDDESIPCAS